MRVYTYKPPKIKSSIKSINVLNKQGESVCSFKRIFKHRWQRLADVYFGNNYFVTYNVYSDDGRIIYQGKKIPRWGKTQYKIIHIATNEEYHITYTSWQAVSPEIEIISSSTKLKLVVKKSVLESASVYYNEVEVVKWKMEMMKLFQSTIEISNSSPIQDVAFFVCFFQCVFYLGE